MLSTLRWAGKAANANSLADPNATFDPTLPCATGEEAAVDALVKADAPKRLLERLQKKPQEIGPDCLYENAESILRFFEEDIVLHVVKHIGKSRCTPQHIPTAYTTIYMLWGTGGICCGEHPKSVIHNIS